MYIRRVEKNTCGAEELHIDVPRHSCKLRSGLKEVRVEHRVVAAVVAPHVADLIRAAASADGRSVSSWLRRLVERELERDQGTAA